MMKFIGIALARANKLRASTYSAKENREFISIALAVLSTLTLAPAASTLDKSHYVHKPDGSYAVVTPWTWDMGWNNLTPSKSTLTDGEKILGPGSFVNEEDSKQIYNFAAGVQIKVLKGTQTIEEITVGSESAGKPGWPAFPANKNAFLKQYGIAPGVTATYTNGQSSAISRLKFTYLKIVDSDPLAGECKTRFNH